MILAKQCLCLLEECRKSVITLQVCGTVRLLSGSRAANDFWRAALYLKVSCKKLLYRAKVINNFVCAEPVKASAKEGLVLMPNEKHKCHCYISLRNI